MSIKNGQVDGRVLVSVTRLERARLAGVRVDTTEPGELVELEPGVWVFLAVEDVAALLWPAAA